jgi:hypothetical protein
MSVITIKQKELLGAFIMKPATILALMSAVVESGRKAHLWNRNVRLSAAFENRSPMLHPPPKEEMHLPNMSI